MYVYRLRRPNPRIHVSRRRVLSLVFSGGTPAAVIVRNIDLVGRRIEADMIGIDPDLTGRRISPDLQGRV